MLQKAISLLFPLFSLVFSILSVSAMNSVIYSDCSNVCYPSMTPYESNLNSLFTSLVESASVSNFNKFEVSQSDIVYGLFQCRGDLSSSMCKECVANSVSQLKTTCSMSTSGTMQLDGCFVKYDNTSFFGTQDKMEMLKRCGPSIGYNSDVCNRISEALAYLINGNGNYFRGGDFGSIQGMAQCVQDLSVSDCQDCLSEAVGRLRSECVTTSWGDMYLGKCYIQYANQGNDNNNFSNRDKHQGGGANYVIVSIIAAVVSAVVGGGLSASVSYKSYSTINNFHTTVKGIQNDVDIVKTKTNKLDEKEEGLKSMVIEVGEKNKKADERLEEAEKAIYAIQMRDPYYSYPRPPCSCY